MSISIFKYVLITHHDKLNSFWSNSITKSQGSSNKILMLSWLHPDSEYFSPSFHEVNICKYNSVSPKIRHTLIYWVSSKLEIIWEVRDWEITIKPLNWKAGKSGCWNCHSFLAQNLLKGQKVQEQSAGTCVCNGACKYFRDKLEYPKTLCQSPTTPCEMYKGKRRQDACSQMA